LIAHHGEASLRVRKGKRNSIFLFKGQEQEGQLLLLKKKNDSGEEKKHQSPPRKKKKKKNQKKKGGAPLRGRSTKKKIRSYRRL